MDFIKSVYLLTSSMFSSMMSAPSPSVPPVSPFLGSLFVICMCWGSDTGFVPQTLDYGSHGVLRLLSVVITTRAVLDWKEPIIPVVAHDRFEVPKWA